ncbi:MAG: pyridoxal-phosphate dependent enzyme [Actinomycetota bacterium]
MTVTGADNPFLAFRHHLDLYAHALECGLDDAGYRELVTEADDRLAAVAGTGFRVTPLVELTLDAGRRLATPPPQPVVAKVETGSVGGSHKARHLFGLLLRLLIDQRAQPDLASRPLAIASCGNAALGAALVARSAERELRVFVPTDADPAVLAELERLDARTSTCARRPGGPDGDPCIHALDESLTEGALPFTVQGTRVAAVIDGGRTLGLELAAQLRRRRLTAGRLFIQIGGGALATAVMDGLVRAELDRVPALHPVQAAAAHPYVAAARLAEPILSGIGPRPGVDAATVRAEVLAALDAAEAPLMVPWPETPRSVASGILDDVTYDWRTVLAHQVATGGRAITVEETTFVEAARLGSQLDPPPDETGAAGLAGLLTVLDEGDAPDADPDTLSDADADPDAVDVVLLTGVRRSDG